MSPANKALIVALIGTLGLWGCAKGPSNAGTAERVKALEAKLMKLEEDFRAVASARDQVRQKLTVVEEQKNLLQKEREELKLQITTRTGERDALQVQYDQFRKALKDLLGQAEAKAFSSEPPVNAVTSR
jgi:chromosome segregation ATPase